MYLLDTHIFLWRILEPHRLSQQQAEALDDITNQHFLSPISVWEMLVLARKRKVDLGPDPRSFVQKALADSPTTMAPMTFEIAIKSESLSEFKSSDPADRFLVATSIVEDLRLITADEKMLQYGQVRTL